MGLLKVGRPLRWEDALEQLEYVREHGVLQFLHTYSAMRGLRKDTLKWGEEIECGIFKVDPSRRTVRLSLRAPEIVQVLQDKEVEHEDHMEGCTWQPEFGSWMVESTPSRPYTGYAVDLLRVEPNMRLRRRRLLSVLQEGEICPTITGFPLMGVGVFTDPPLPPGGPVCLSDSIPDGVLNPHPRFAALASNIRSRRGRKVDVRVPIFRDTITPGFGGGKNGDKGGEDPDAEGYVWQLDGVEDADLPTSPVGSGSLARRRGSFDLTPAEPKGPNGEPVVAMDAMAYGMGMCCLQVTFQARDVDESRYLYDQLAVLAPIMLALTAATPILKGRLVDTDVRWDVIAGSVDCRTRAEMGLDDTKDVQPDPRMAGGGVRRIRKSRYSAVSCYIYHCEDMPASDRVLDQYNDVEVEVDERLQRVLEEGGVDRMLARHVAHLFVRDPLVIFDGAAEVDDRTSTEHFENIQSTNWNTVRWKPPPPPTPSGPRIGWRTEFRPMEIQLTDFENAAFTVFVVLLTRVILAFDLHLYLPISKVDENMARAERRNSAMSERFFFRKNMAPEAGDGSGPSHCFCSEVLEYEEMTIAEIMTGKGTYFTGLIPLCYAYLEHIRCDRQTCKVVGGYLEFIRKRATGELPTTATWIRRFVSRHPDYRHDSVVGQGVAYDLLMECQAIGEGLTECPELLGDVKIAPINTEEAYDVFLSSSRVVNSERRKVLARYLNRCSFAQRRQRSRTGGEQSDMDTDASGSSSQAPPLTPLLTPGTSGTSV